MRFPFAAREESGIALITALLTLLVLSTLTASFVLVSQTEIWSTSNYKTVTQSRYLAEAGAERTIEWLRRSYTAPSATYTVGTDGALAYNGNPVQLSGIDGYSSNFPSSAMTDSFYSALHNQTVSATGISGTYSSRAILLDDRMTTTYSGTPGTSQMWKIISEGRIAGVRNAVVEVQEIVERRGLPAFNYGLFATGTGCAIINFSAVSSTPGYVDSYDSSAGTYAATHQNSGGDVGSNGHLALSGYTNVYGTYSTPLTNSASGGCSSLNPNQITDTSTGDVTGGANVLPAPVTFENPLPIYPTPPTTTKSINTDCGTTIPGCSGTAPDFYLAPGTYGNLTMSATTLIAGQNVPNNVFFSAGTYNINSITTSGKLQVSSGPVRINVAGAGSLPGGAAVNLLGSGGVFNNTGVPSNLAWVYGGTGLINMAGGSDAYEVVYAPNAFVNLSGSSDFYGGIVCKKFNSSGGSKIHYDRSLNDTFIVIYTWRPISISRSKY